MKIHTLESFFNAAAAGNADVVRQCLEAGIDPSTLNEQGESVVTWTAMVGQIAALDLLLAIIKKPDLPNSDGFTALAQAILAKDAQRIEVLLNHGADPGYAILTEKVTCNHLAMRYIRNPTTLSRILRKSSTDSLIAVDDLGEPPLFVGIESNTAVCVCVLLRELVDRQVSIETRYGELTAYQHALAKGRSDIASAIRELVH